MYAGAFLEIILLIGAGKEGVLGSCTPSSKGVMIETREAYQMPVLHLKRPNEAPLPSRSSRAVREQQQKYDNFIRQVETSDVGELELEPGENVRSVKVRLRRASSRLGVDIDTWDANGRVYFRRVTRRRRPRKQSA